MEKPISPAKAPSRVNTREKPITKLRACKNIGRRIFFASPLNTSPPIKLARYTGTSGSTQGDTKESRPAPMATKAGMGSIRSNYILLK